MPTRPVSAVAMLLLAMLLSGCAGGDAPAGAPPAPTADGLPGERLAHNGSAPSWTVGQWWDHKWFFGTTASEPFTVKTVVAEGRGASVLVATDDPLTSALHGAFIFPTLGEFTMDPLVGSVGDHRWPWYHFPLTDGQGWTDTLSTRDGNGGIYEIPVSAVVTANPAIITAIGEQPGFDIEMRSEGRLFATYDYVPAVGWMSRATFYDLAAEGEVTQFILEMSAMGSTYSGPYYDTTGDVLSTHFNLFVPTAPAAPNPQSSFMVTEAHTQVLAFPYSFAAAGTHTTGIVAPDGRHWESTYTADHAGTVLHSLGPVDGMVFEPAATGEWRVLTAGAGAFAAGGGVLAYGTTQQAKTL